MWQWVMVVSCDSWSCMFAELYMYDGTVFSAGTNIRHRNQDILFKGPSHPDAMGVHLVIGWVSGVQRFGIEFVCLSEKYITGHTGCIVGIFC